MKTVIMTATAEPTGYEIFDKIKKNCGCGCKKEKTSCGCQGNSNTQTMGKIKVTGTIVDKNTKEPLIGAHVQNLETKEGTVTDGNGYYSLLGSNDHLIKISFVGYKDLTLPISNITDMVELEEDGLLDEIVITAKKSVTKNAGLIVGIGLLSLFTYAKTKQKKVVSTPSRATK